MNLRLTLAALFALFYTFTFAQTTIFSESIGIVTANTAISVHEFNNGFDNPDLSMTDGGAPLPADIRNSSSIGGTGSSNANVWFTNTNGVHGFAIENIGASGFTNLTLQFNYRKENAAVHANFAVHYWDGSSWVLVAGLPAQIFNEPSTASVNWYLSNIITLPPGAQVANLKLRFTKSGTDPIRIDNIILKGNNTCAPASNVITPLSGPVGTEITVTGSSGNLNAATATIGGVSAVVSQISPTQIKVIVPAGAISGALVTTIAGGCTVSNPFTVIDKVITACQGSGTARNKIFISEITDHGTGGHTYIELFNATGSTVNLLNYKVNIHNNGAATATSSITLPSYSLPNNATYLVAIGGTDATTQYASVVANITSGVGGLNGNDHVRLLDNTGTWIDLWGATSNTFFAVATKNYYYRRKNVGIIAPSITWNPNDWTSGVPVNYSDIGFYDFSAGTAPIVNNQPSSTADCKSTSFQVLGSEGAFGGFPLAYQWYYVPPNATTWTAVTNTGVFSGANANLLTISDTAGLEDYQFYVQVRENSATCYTASNAVIIKVNRSTWNGTSWIPAAPISNTVATINGNYNTSSNGSFEACSLIINPTGMLTISPNTYVSIENNLSAQGTLNIQDAGSLVMNDNSGTVINTGTTNVLRKTTPYKRYDYTYWSSPVANANIASTFAGWRLDYGFTFNTANYSDLTGPDGTGGPDGFDDDSNVWIPIATPTMTNGVGYAIMAPTIGTFPAISTVTFTGAVNNGIVTVPIAVSANAAEANDDYNLVGNPYPSAISGHKLMTDNSAVIGNALYFWTHRTAISTSAPGPNYSNFVVDDYAMYNLSGGTASASGSLPPTGFIASGQGFIVEATVSGTLTFDNSMRSKSHINSDFFKTANQVQDRLWLNLESLNGLFSQQLIGYFPEATNDVDWGYDGAIMPSQNAISFYSFIEDKTFRIQGRAPFNINDKVTLGYKSVAGQFSILIGNSEGQLANVDHIYLEDKLLGLVHDLKQSTYNFETTAGIFNDRFVLKFTNESLSINDSSVQSNLVIAASNNQVMLKSREVMESVKFYDMLGRLVYSSQINSDTFTTSALPANGVLIAKVKFANGQNVERKVML